jgi:hypothetical protein
MSEAAPSEIQKLWRALAKTHPAWSMLPDALFSSSAWSLFGTDMTSGLVRNPKARRVAAILEGRSDEVLANIAAIGQLNAERATAVFRNIAVVYVTLPIAAVALMSDAAPDFLRAFLTANADNLVRWLLILAITPAIYFLIMWRAKQLSWTIDCVRAGAVEPARK